MKKIFNFAVMALTVAVLLTACGSKGFKTTETGLMYKIEVSNPTGAQPSVGDVLVGEMTFTLDADTLYTNEGKPDRIIQVLEKMFDGDINEGLMMMHVGEKATFGVDADAISSFFQEGQMPPQYKKGTNQKFYYTIKLDDIVTKEDLQQERANFETEMKDLEANEPEIIANYIKENNITAKPTANGLYIIVNKKGNGPVVAAGKHVALDYTGRLLDGTIFDSSREADAREAGKYDERRPYEPLAYTVGEQSLIPGWEQGVMGQPEGTELTLIIPSKLGYGSRGAGRDIRPFSPLRFDITVVSVK